MARPRGLLVKSAAGWRLITARRSGVRAHDVTPLEEAAEGEAILAELQEIARGRWRLIVAPSAGSTMAVRLSEEALGGSRKVTQEQLAFAAEEHLPWAAEDVTVGTMSRSPVSLALTIQTDRWEELLSGLRAAGHLISACVPAVLIRLAAVRKGLALPADSAVLFRDDEGLQYLQLEQGQVAAWKFWPDDVLEHGPHLLAAEIAAEPPAGPVFSLVDEDSLSAALERSGLDVAVRAPTEDDDALLLWRGAEEFWKPRARTFNLALGRLAGVTRSDAAVGALRTVCLSLMLCCSVAAGLLFWKSEEYRQAAAEFRSRQEQLFQETFPGVPVPQALSTRFESEHRRIVGERGGSVGGAVELPAAALTGLAAVLTAHQAPLRSQFEEVNVIDDLVEIEAKFRNHEDAARMVERLEQAGLKVDPPQLQKLDEQRFGTRMRGRLRSPDQGAD